MQHLKRVACAVAHGQHHVVGAQLVAADNAFARACTIVFTTVCQGLHAKAANLAAFNQHITHALLKPNFSPQRFNLRAHVLNYLDQFEGADMRLANAQNFIGCARLDELVHDLAA